MLAYETEIFTQVLEGNVLVVLGKVGMLLWPLQLQVNLARIMLVPSDSTPC